MVFPWTASRSANHTPFKGVCPPEAGRKLTVKGLESLLPYSTVLLYESTSLPPSMRTVLREQSHQEFRADARREK